MLQSLEFARQIIFVTQQSNALTLIQGLQTWECVIFGVRLLFLKRVILKFVLLHFEAQCFVLWTILITRVINITSTQNLAKCNINSIQFPIKFISFQLPSFELKPENLHCIANSLSVGLLSWHVKATIAQGKITAKAECDISSRDFSVSRLFLLGKI